MKALLFLLSLAATAIAGDVIQLTPDNFDEVVGNTDNILTLVKFYAPWCGHCKAMAADYESAATQLKEINPKLVLAELDADAHRDFAGKFDVQGFPTLKVFRGGELTSTEDYSGPRDLAGIVKTVQKLSRPPLTVVDSQAALDKAVADGLEAGELVVSGVFEKEGKEVETFKKFAKKTKSFTVVSFVGGAKRAVALHLPGEPAIEYTEKKLTAAKLTAWSDANKFPLYAEINQDNFKSYVDRGIPLVWIFTDPEADSTAEIAKSVAPAAKALKGKVSFVHLSGIQYGGMAQRVGLKGEAWPSVAVDDSKTKKHFGYSPEGTVPTAEELEKFVTDAIEGKVEATVRSEDEPAEQPGEDGVFVLTGKNFVASTLESGMDVMIEFYAPWCGHCKALAPEYSALAKETAGSKKLRIAKMDATQNDIPSSQFDVQGYPTLYFVKASGEVSAYSGGRTKADILSFLQENAENPITVADA